MRGGCGEREGAVRMEDMCKRGKEGMVAGEEVGVKKG